MKTIEEYVEEFDDMLSFVEVQLGVNERDRLRSALTAYAKQEIENALITRDHLDNIPAHGFTAP